MSDQPETPAKQQSITINLSDLAKRYLGALQRTYDTAAMVVQGTREVNERGYDEMTVAPRYLPSQKDRRPFATAKPMAERWILRNLLSDAFGLLIPFLEDVRTICALHAWKKAGSDQATLGVVFQEQRADFVKKNMEEKLAHLKSAHALDPALSRNVASLEKLAACLVRNDGTVPKEDPALEVHLVSLDLVAAPEAPKKVQPRMAETKKEFAPGTEVELDKVEFMNVLATVALFVNATLRLLQERVKE